LGILHALIYGLLSIGILGLMCSTGFLILVLYSVLRLVARPKPARNNFTPRVTLLKTVCGLEPQLEENLESFFTQEYPAFEMIFGARNNDDPALRIVERLRDKYPMVPVKVVFSGEPQHPNAKVCSLEKMISVATTAFYVISDSDVHVEPNYIREIIGPFSDPAVGVVTCLYRGVPTGGLWSRLEALGMSVEMTAGVVSANTLEGMKFALGPTMVARREALEPIGGIGRFLDYCSDDFLLGNLIAEAGWKVILSHHVIDHVVLNRNFRSSIQHQTRWMKSTRFSRPKGHFGTVLTFAMPFGLLGLAAALLLGRPILAAEIIGWTLLNRFMLSIATGWFVVGDSNSLKHCWLFPLRDLMGFFFWAASYGNPEIVWRGERYRLTPGGKMERISPSKDTSRTVAVDHLA
jgi:ceramide glucosyltransferase